MPHPLRTRLYTSWGTVIYKDVNSGILRHGAIGKCPENIVLEFVEHGSQSILRGRLVELQLTDGQSGVTVQDRLDPETNNGDASFLSIIFDVVHLKCGVVALASEGRFLSAEPTGSLTLSVPWCKLWEFFIISETLNERKQMLASYDDTFCDTFDLAKDQLKVFTVDPRLRTKAIIEGGILNPVASPVEHDDGLSIPKYRSSQTYTKQFHIFRTLHIVWVGDPARRPDSCIETWRQMNPDWTVRVWGNSELGSEAWQNMAHLREMSMLELCGVADIIRWEILDRFGGFAIDADSICVRPIEEWLFEPELFACWENEIARPGLIANGYVYSHPGNALIRQIIKDILELPNMNGGRAWQLVGPKRLTDTYRKMGYTGMTIYPSHYFIPTHLTGVSYSGSGHVFAKQLWGSTKDGFYDNPQHINIS